MNLIDTYVNEVGRRLPLKNRADIEAEIRSALEDMLEERSRKENKPVDDEMTFAVLREYGDPEKVAASYLPERYLIGPALYPIFILLAKVILVITGIVVLIGMGVALGQSAHDLASGLEILGKAFSNFFTSVFSSVAMLVLILAGIEWTIRFYGEKVEVKGLPVKKAWDPHSLARISLPNKIRLGEVIGEIAGTFIAILLFNFYPQAFTLGYGSNGQWYVGTGSWTSVPLLSQAFFHYVPFLTVIWALTILLDILLLWQGYWSLPTRLYSIVLKVINIAISAAMLAGPSLIALTAHDLPASLAGQPELQSLIGILPQIVRIVLWLNILGNTVEIIRTISRMITNRPMLRVVSGKSS